ncbi:MAG: hypothetical protein ABSA76_05430, partial [Bacteroidales bacterium]
NLTPGDLISYMIDDYRAHSAIFVKWKDRSNEIAELFDWGSRDNKGNMIYRTYEANINKNSHPIFMYWKSIKNN